MFDDTEIDLLGRFFKSGGVFLRGEKGEIRQHISQKSFLKTPNGKWVRVKRRWGIYILIFLKRDLFVFLSVK